MVSPYFRSPFTDLGAGVLSNQWNPKCRDLEMRAVDCVEAYGLDRGLQKCSDLLRDLEECATHKRQFKRVQAMRNERDRKWRAGKLEEHHAPSPVPDTY